MYRRKDKYITYYCCCLCFVETPACEYRCVEGDDEQKGAEDRRHETESPERLGFCLDGSGQPAVQQAIHAVQSVRRAIQRTYVRSRSSITHHRRVYVCNAE